MNQAFKKISIVTWIGSGNYGTALQSFALHRYLADRGHDVSLVYSSPFQKGLRHIIKVIVYRLGLMSILLSIRERKKNNKERLFDKFVKENYNIPTLVTKKEINNYYKGIDVLISGSDQIWNSYYLFDEFMFLGFDIEKRRVAYASSIGTNSINPTYENRIREMLMKYDYIGVREQEAVNVLSRLTGRKDIVQVLDPTFLLNAEDWGRITESASQPIEAEGQYILCYLIGNNDWYKEQLENVSKQYGIANVIIVPSEENPHFSIPNAKILTDIGPLEFVRLIKNAALVCTDSFHATALSINQNRNFVEFVRFKTTDVKSQNSRIYDLLNHYDLSSRLYSSDSTSWIGDIDYTSVTSILEEDRLRSQDYLNKAIES